MDHGILNVPLRKRGDIDSELDAYKRDHDRLKKAQAKAKAAVQRDLVKQAKAHVESLSAERIKDLAVKFGKTPKQTKDYLLSQAFWQPALIVKL